MKIDWLRAPLLTHRGLHGPNRPENSLAAVDRSVIGGFGVEVDVRLCSDDIPVVHHDATLRRMCGLPKLIRRLPATTLTRIPLADGEHRIPRLADVLDVVKGQVPLILDLKGRLAGAERVVLVNAIAHAVLGYPGPIAVVAFDPLLLDVVSHRLPAMPRGQNGGLPRSLALHLSSATRLAWRRWLSRLAPPHFVSLNVAGLPYLNLEGVRRSGLRAVGWTVRTRQQLQSLTGTLDNFMIEGEAVPPHLHTSNAAPGKAPPRDELSPFTRAAPAKGPLRAGESSVAAWRNGTLACARGNAERNNGMSEQPRSDREASSRSSGGFFEDFDGADLDAEVWLPHYLPMWSSRAESAATYTVTQSELRLTIPPEQGLWCAGDHDPLLRVSGIQSGVFSGPVGSTIGQQPFRDGAVVREFQPTHWGWTPLYGLLEVRARMNLSRRSMAAIWMVGLEDQPTRCGEICIVEVFGETLDPAEPSAAVGIGVHPFRDPKLTEEFSAQRVALDVTEFHVYAAAWQPGHVDFLFDGRHIRTIRQAPDYPMQMMIAVFDFPEKANAGPDHLPELAIDYIRQVPPSDVHPTSPGR